MSEVSGITKVPTFRYEDKDFNLVVTTANGLKSRFDSFLTEKWQDARENGIFWVDLNIPKERTLPGNYGFLAQLHPDKGKKRRKLQVITSMLQPFDSREFNFTNLPNEEILFDVGNGDGNDIVAVNVSPSGMYHSLLIVERFKCLPQRATRHSIEKAVDLMLLSNSPYFRIIFNSSCAHASVNHLHWHLYYLKRDMPLESIKLNHLRGPVFMLKEFPAKGFCLKLSSFSDPNAIGDLVSWTYFIVDRLHKSEIPYSVCLTRAKENIGDNVYEDVRVYIWGRKPGTRVTNRFDFAPSVCEFFGHLIITSRQLYDELTEESVDKILNDLTSDSFSAVRDDVLGMDLNGKELIMAP
ncbi:GDP-D-glucose phosphorylase 1-like isoform X1 [Neodiprion fabricii]|uniref:GDP-D-glucose phosphorylase 1-like isoform X1 n=1 Tax=Neodiprion fabricii TaxID=2872261 RepID=UPI001ED97BB7|nr:GDP-D-glucose phosphorylase 1-like isoform X1 [Neodiprion fabricii]XP_046411822.1 GDP-D-glucose phosphorylase 1-like isoform X1 [Neodiprion fabricii]